MKKMVIAMAMLVMLASCGGSGETPATDSLVAPVDSVNVVTDSAQLNDAVSGSESTSKISTDNKDNESLEEVKLP
jgi:uncharacterized protein YcfL